MVELEQSYAYLVDYLGEGNQAEGRGKFEKIIKKKGGLKAFIGFKMFVDTDGNEKNEMIRFLDQGMGYDQKTIIGLIEKNFFTLFGSELTQANAERAFVDKVHTALNKDNCPIALSP